MGFKAKPWEHNRAYTDPKGRATNHHISVFDSMVYSDAWRLLSPSAYKVYTLLAIQYRDRPDQLNGLIKCPYSFITEKTGLSKATVSKSLEELERLGFIKVKTRGGFGVPSEYYLSADWMKVKDNRKNEPP